MKNLIALSLFVCPFYLNATTTKETCAVAHLTTAATCKDLKVDFDFSECHGDEGLRRAWISCGQDSAVAGLKYNNKNYRVKLTYEETGRWGQGKWALGSDPTEQMDVVRKPASQISTPQPPTTSAAPPTPVPSLLSDLTFSGMFDGYFAYNFNSPPRKAAPTADNVFHPYDTYHNQFTLSAFEFTIKKTAKDINLLVDLMFGQQAELNATDQGSKNIGQAILSWTPASIPRFSVDIGKMYSPLGLETPKAINNWNYSRSLLFGSALPSWHSGVFAHYDLIPDHLNGGFFVFNGWNNMNSINSGKTVGGQLRWSLSKDSNITYNFIGGPQQPQSGVLRMVHEINTTLVLNSRFTVAADFTAGREDNSSWRAATVAMKYQLNDSLYISPRAEVFDDIDGFLLGTPGSRQLVQSYTLTASYLLSGGLETRLEVRRDSSNAKTEPFQTTTGTSSAQTTILGALLYKF